MQKQHTHFYLPELDGLRFFAFLLVFIHHHPLFREFFFYLPLLNHYGWIGVDLFFVLSAFLFTKLLRIEHQSTQGINFQRFYIRRILRIWPLYFVFIFACIIYDVLTESTLPFYRLVGFLTFSDNLLCIFEGYSSISFTSHLWTICYEEQFYIFVPLIIYLLTHSSKADKLIFLVTIFAILNGIRLLFLFIDVPHPTIWVLPFTHFESIMLGVVIGFNGLNFITQKLPSYSFLLFAFGGLLWLFFGLPNVGSPSYMVILTYLNVGLITSSLLLAVLHISWLRRFLAWHGFVFLGKRSYGMYIFHFLGNHMAHVVVEQFALPSSTVMLFLYSLIFTIMAAILSYEFLEKPFLHFKKKYELINSRPV